MKKRRKCRIFAGILAVAMAVTLLPQMTLLPKAASNVKAGQVNGGYQLSNDTFQVEIGAYGEIKSLKIVGDKFDTNYVMNEEDNPKQKEFEGIKQWHQWLGEIMFSTRLEGSGPWETQNTTNSDRIRSVKMEDDQVVVTYDPDGRKSNDRELSNLKVTETYALVGDQLKWEIKIENKAEKEIEVGDMGLPLPFREYWKYAGEAYEVSTVDHSFVGRDSSYVYATRPQSMNGGFVLMTPEVSTGAGFEYQDHWIRGTEGRVPQEYGWCMDQGDWANGLNVFYIHSNKVKSGNKGYMPSTSLYLKPSESKTYMFNFSAPANEKEMKSILYEENILDAVAVPGMIISKNMDAQMYLHTPVKAEDITITGECPHDENVRHSGTNTVKMAAPKCGGKPAASYDRKVEKDGESYLIYKLDMKCLGQNDLIVNYKVDGQPKETRLQYYIIDDIDTALSEHSEFIVNNTQHDLPGQLQDKVFDDWMMDKKSKRNEFYGYWGWGDDWGYVHAEYLAEMNAMNPKANQVKALDEYLDVAIWRNLMQEHQEDYKIHDFLMKEPNTTPLYRGFAYTHIYNTYFGMYKIAHTYPGLVDFKEDADTYLIRAYNIMMALYADGVGFNWATGTMGESTNPEIMEALKERGFTEESEALDKVLRRKLKNFDSEKYPYVSEYPYDNTSEEAIYTLAKMYGDERIMKMVEEKTRACRGVQPIWYHYANPTTICGENYFNFQYTASLAGIAMDDWLRVQVNGMSAEEMGEAARVNYAAKLANLSVINSGQIHSDPANIGTSSWTYQSEMGNYTAMGTGGGQKYNGWRQMSGESDLALFGAIRILSSDVANDPVFGLVGYGCQVTDENGSYTVIPKDGLYKSVNLINEQLSVELVQDKYGKAVIRKDGTSIVLDEFENVSGLPHDAVINLAGKGIASGNYEILADGMKAGTFTVDHKDTDHNTVVKVPVGETIHKIEIRKTEHATGMDTVVDAGKDQEVTLVQAKTFTRNYGYTAGMTTTQKELLTNGTICLDGHVRNKNQLQADTAVKWEVKEKPSGARVDIDDADSMVNRAAMDQPGTYVFRLTAVNEKKSDEVTVKVTEDKALPEMLARYGFEEADTDLGGGKTKSTADQTGTYDGKYDGDVKAQPAYTESQKDSGRCIQMKGGICGYIRLPKTLTQNVEEATISMDVSLSGRQSAGAPIFLFSDSDGRSVQAYFDSGNEICIAVSKADGSKKEAKSAIMPAEGYWKNIEVTISSKEMAIYVNGRKSAQIEDPGVKLSDLSPVQNNYLGRGRNDTDPWLNAKIDNFVMYTKAYDEAKIKELYYIEEDEGLKEIVKPAVATSVKVKPDLPSNVHVVYNNGMIKSVPVTWDEVKKEQYAKTGSFEVQGTLQGMNEKAGAAVQVVESSFMNLEQEAVPSAIYNDVENDVGAEHLNDGYEPGSSRDKSQGMWHNWEGGKVSEPAWVQYDWEEPVLLTKSDAYYYTDGNFEPSSVRYQYMDEKGKWQDVEQVQGLGIKLDQYNTTTFQPVRTKAIRMIMTPKIQACGVIEWKVYGYADQALSDRIELKALVSQTNVMKQELFTDGWEILQAALVKADKAIENKETSPDEVEAALKGLKTAMRGLKPKDDNLAFMAKVSYSYVSEWETPGAANDGIVSQKSNDSSIPHYGSWGNVSDRETAIYTWAMPVEISKTGIFFWTDGGGIHFPKSYIVEYLDSDRNWSEVPKSGDYTIAADQYNDVEMKENITTTSIRLTMEKDAFDKLGIGLVEWTVTGKLADEQDRPLDPADKKELKAVIEKAESSVKDEDEDQYTADSWKAYQEALKMARDIYADEQAGQEETDHAVKVLEDALAGLKKADPPKPIPVTEIFEDITEESWFIEYVQYVYDNDIMKGLTETVFGADVKLSRAHFATILYRMAGSPDVSYKDNFPDVPDNLFYTKPVMWASRPEVNVISGYEDGRFGPDDNLTREQLAVMLYRYARYMGYENLESEDYSRFEDADCVSLFAKEAMQWAVAHRMITGDNGKLNPQGESSRAVCAAIITRFMKEYKPAETDK